MPKEKIFILLIVLLSFALCFLSFSAELPKDIKWETNMTDPPIGDPKALKGGTLFYYLDDYPLTFRLMGPNSL